MKKSKVILFSANYPYNIGEEFLATELVYLNNVFDVVVVPCAVNQIKCNRDPKLAIDRYLIDNIKIFNLLYAALKNLCSIGFYRSLYQERQTVGRLGLHGIKRFMSQYAKARITARFIQNTLGLTQQQVIFYCYWLDFPVLAFKFIQPQDNYKIISRAHGVDLFADQNIRGYVPLQLQKIRLLDRLILVSDNGMEYLLSKYGNQLRDKLVVSKLGVSKIFPNNQPYDGKNLCLISISSCVVIKRIHLIIDLITKIRDHGVNLVWQHIGDGDLFSQIQKYAATNLKNGFLFHGYKSNYEVHEILAKNQFTALINCSFSEGLPISMQEAQAYGLPIIATNVGGVAEIFDNYNCGWLIARDFNLEDVASMLAVELCNPELCLIKSENSYRSFVSKYQAEVNYSAFCKLLQEL